MDCWILKIIWHLLKLTSFTKWDEMMRTFLLSLCSESKRAPPDRAVLSGPRPAKQHENPTKVWMAVGEKNEWLANGLSCGARFTFTSVPLQGPTPAPPLTPPWGRQRTLPRRRLDPRRKATPEPPRWTSTSFSSRGRQVPFTHARPQLTDDDSTGGTERDCFRGFGRGEEWMVAPSSSAASQTVRFAGLIRPFWNNQDATVPWLRSWIHSLIMLLLKMTRLERVQVNFSSTCPSMQPVNQQIL